MRILHTADWHMNDTLGRIDRRDDICRALEQIAAYLEEYAVDVMIVAGDIFERSRLDQLRHAVAQIKRIFTPFLRRGGAIVAITGNHDNEVFCETLRDALDLVAPEQAGHGEVGAASRFYLAPHARLLKLADPQGGIVQFALMPYPTTRYLYGSANNYRTIEEKHQAIQAAFTETLRRLEAQLDPTLPSVLVSHIHVRGVHVHERYRLTEREDVIFEPSDIPTHWAYVAYGHMHQPQTAVPGATHIRYAGSIERLDAGDRDDNKSVVLVDIDPGGRRGEPRLLPLESTPIYRIDISDPEREMANLADRYPDAVRALVYYTLHWQPGKHDLDALNRQMTAIFPRWYDRTLIQEGGGSTAERDYTAEQLVDVVGTVRTYLQTQLTGHADREDLLALAEQLLAAEEIRQ